MILSFNDLANKKIEFDEFYKEIISEINTTEALNIYIKD